MVYYFIKDNQVKLTSVEQLLLTNKVFSLFIF